MPSVKKPLAPAEIVDIIMEAFRGDKKFDVGRLTHAMSGFKVVEESGSHPTDEDICELLESDEAWAEDSASWRHMQSCESCTSKMVEFHVSQVLLDTTVEEPVKLTDRRKTQGTRPKTSLKKS